jgi:hypothetical protein
MKLYEYELAHARIDAQEKFLMGDFSSGDDLVNYVRRRHPLANAFAVVAVHADETLDATLWIMERGR